MPPVCACCGGASTTAVPVSAVRVRGKRVIRTTTSTWEFPFCGRCCEHDRVWPKARWSRVLLLAVLTLGLYLYFYVKRRRRALALRAPGCAMPLRAVAYLGWHGTVHELEVASEDFARAFMAANAKKLVGADAEAREILARPEPAPVPAPATRPVAQPMAQAAVPAARAVAARAEIEPPERDAWDAAIRTLPRAGAVCLIPAGRLAALAGIEVGERVTGARLRKAIEAAARLGYAVEPDARVAAKAVAAEAELAIWRTGATAVPDAALWRSVHTMLCLTLSVALADGHLAETEGRTLDGFVEDLFALDGAMRARAAALRAVLARQPARATTVARKLQESRSARELAKIGRVLVAVAAVDGVIAPGEHRSLKSLYKAMGLPPSALASALAASGARLPGDDDDGDTAADAGKEKGKRAAVVDAVKEKGKRAAAVDAGKEKGRRVAAVADAEAAAPAPAPAPALDAPAIAAILAETREVALLLSQVLDDEEDEEDEEDAAPGRPATLAASSAPSAPSTPTDGAASAPSVANAPSTPSTPADGAASVGSAATAAAATATATATAAAAANGAWPALDARYHGVLRELLTRPVWTVVEIRAIATREKMMPGAILETLNAWSEERYGDHVIEEAGDWRINAQLLERPTA